MRMIDANALKTSFEEDGHLSNYIEEFIDNAPTIDAVPVVKTKWISVKDRMPKKYQTVIVHVQNPKKCRNVHPSEFSWHVVEEDIWFGDNWCNNDDQNIREVTHWMPMPEPPDGGKSNEDD